MPNRPLDDIPIKSQAFNLAFVNRVFINDDDIDRQDE